MVDKDVLTNVFGALSAHFRHIEELQRRVAVFEAKRQLLEEQTLVLRELLHVAQHPPTDEHDVPLEQTEVDIHSTPPAIHREFVEFFAQSAKAQKRDRLGHKSEKSKGSSIAKPKPSTPSANSCAVLDDQSILVESSQC